MKPEDLFREYYLSNLLKNGVDNLVFRKYSHSIGANIDNPKDKTNLIFSNIILINEVLSKLFLTDDSTYGIAITSIVTHKTEIKFLFLLDCSLSISNENEKEVINIINKFKTNLKAFTNAMLIKTDKSYHIASFVPLSIEEWRYHMAQALLMQTSRGENIADIRYVGHSLERDYGSLRFSAYEDKKVPEFICYI